MASFQTIAAKRHRGAAKPRLGTIKAPSRRFFQCAVPPAPEGLIELQEVEPFIGSDARQRQFGVEELSFGI
jgi:hypothetical protein